MPLTERNLRCGNDISRVYYLNSDPFIIHMKQIQLHLLVSNNIPCQDNKRNKSWKERSIWLNVERDLQARLPYWAELVLPWQLLTAKERLRAPTRPTCSSPNTVKCCPSPTVSSDIPLGPSCTNLLEMRATFRIHGVGEVALKALLRRAALLKHWCCLMWCISSGELTRLSKTPSGPVD